MTEIRPTTMELHKDKYRYQEKRNQQEAPGFRRYRAANKMDKDNGRCTFCGAPVEPGMRFCTECGNNREGITCPHCGTLNFRSFCKNCFAPLNEQAQKALTEAKFDPHFQRAEQLVREMAELEKIISEAEAADQYIGAPDRSVRLSDEDRQIIDAYRDLFAGIANPPPPSAPADDPAPATRTRERKQFLIQRAEDAMKLYKSKMAELQMHMDAMLPDSAATPEEQRDFFSARIITTTRIELVKQGWVCNYCGCFHKCPNECAEPQLGGKWVFFEKEVETKQSIID